MRLGQDTIRNTRKQIPACIYSIDVHEFKKSVLPLQRRGWWYVDLFHSSQFP